MPGYRLRAARRTGRRNKMSTESAIFGIIIMLAVFIIPIAAFLKRAFSKEEHTRSCPQCHMSIPDNAEVCPYCRSKVTPTFSSIFANMGKIMLIGVIICAIIAIWVIMQM